MIASARRWRSATRRRSSFGATQAQNRRRIAAWPPPGRAQAEQLVRYATLAANSHNTQPWVFEIADDQIRILADTTRRCHAVDPQDRHLVASLGCAAETLAITAQAAGAKAEFAYDPQTGTALTCLEPAQPLHTPLVDAIVTRQSTRAPFDPSPLPQPDVHALENATRRPDVHARLLTSRSELDTLKDYVIEANTAQCKDRAFVDELRAWIRFNKRHATEAGDGLYVGASGNPAMPRWVGHRVLPMFLTPKAGARTYTAQLDGTAGALVLYPARDRPEVWFEIGRASQRLQLEATARDVRTSFVNQPVEVASTRHQFETWLGDGLRPALVLRFGHGPPLPYSLRRPTSEVIHWAEGT